MNLQLINPDRAPCTTQRTGEAQHPARKFAACAWPLAPWTMTLGQVVRVPTADGTTHCRAKLILPFGKSSQLAGSEPVKVRADAPSLSNWNSPVTHLIHVVRWLIRSVCFLHLLSYSSGEFQFSPNHLQLQTLRWTHLRDLRWCLVYFVESPSRLHPSDLSPWKLVTQTSKYIWLCLSVATKMVRTKKVT